jgi:hypothetical protein
MDSLKEEIDDGVITSVINVAGRGDIKEEIYIIQASEFN